MSHNSDRRKQMLKWLSIAAAILVLLTIIFVVFMKHNATVKKQQNAAPNFVTLNDSQFDNHVAQAAMEQQQGTVSSLQGSIEDLKKQVQDLQQSQQSAGQQQNSSLQQQLSTLQQQLAQAQSPQNQQSPRTGPGSAFNPNALGGGIQTQDAGVQANAIQSVTLNFNVDQPTTPTLNSQNYVPAGTKILAVLTGAADANAAVTGQSNTTPVAFNLVSDAIEPTQAVNGIIKPVKTPLKGCSIIGSAYGDISSERAEIRLVRLSCNMANGSILDIPVQGAVFEGLEGIKGTPIMRNGEILTWAGLSGFMSGIGGAIQQNTTTQSVSPLGATATVNSGQVFQNGLAGGASTSLDMLSQYYIQRAEQYHPIIEIKPGAIVTVLFTEGFSLVPRVDNGGGSSSSSQTAGNALASQTASNNSGGGIQQAQTLMSQISSGQSNATLGQTVNGGN